MKKSTYKLVVLILILAICCMILVTGNKISKDVGIFSRIAQNGEVINQELDELKKYLKEGRRVTFLGDGVPVHKTKIKEEILPGEAVTFAPVNMNRQRAASVGTLGMQYYKEGKIETAMEHEPDYLRVSQAERERKERLGNV